MLLTVTCDCGRSIRVKDSLSGKRIRCPACDGRVLVPAVDEDEEEIEEAEDVGPEPARRRAKKRRPAVRNDKPPYVCLGCLLPLAAFLLAFFLGSFLVL